MTRKSLAAIALTGALSISAMATEYVTIGTGGVTGVYYPLGGSICRLVNKGKKEHGVRCSVESTGGSVYNINTIRAGELEMGVAQSDWQYHAYKGDSKFKSKGAFKDLRAIFSVHGEPFTVVARADSGIKNFDDLKGKRVNIGNPGSGQRGTMEVVMDAKGWSKSDFKLASELKASEQSKALCDNKIDAMVYVVGHPSGSIKEATTTCASKLVTVADSTIDKIVKNNDYYKYTTVPGGMYKGNPNDIKTFGVAATFVTSAKVSEKVIYAVVKSVFENFDTFKKLHPAFRHLTKKDMIHNGNSAPLHRGAIKYYKEAGLL
jgi:TRAP transporter TAXI family solute receptor